METSIRVQDHIEATLPPRLRLLCIGALEPSWVSLTLQLDAEGCLEPILKWVSSAGEALALLRKESFDCLLINQMLLDGPEESSNSSLHLVRAVRASGCDDPVVVVAAKADDATWSEASRLHVELLLTPNGLESMAVVPMLKRALQRVDLMRENHRMAMSERRRLTRERNEAGHLLNEQRQIIRDLGRVDPRTGQPIDGRRTIAVGIKRLLPRTAADLCHHGIGWIGSRDRQIGGIAGRRRSKPTPGLGAASGARGGIGPWTGEPQHPARHGPR